MYPGDPSDPSDHPGEPSGQVDQGMPPFGAQMLAFLSCLFKICVATIVRIPADLRFKFATYCTTFKTRKCWQKQHQ